MLYIILMCISPFVFLLMTYYLMFILYLFYPARGAGTLIPSAQRLVWAAKQALGKAALGALLPDKELCLREALAVCTPPAPEPSAKRPGS